LELKLKASFNKIVTASRSCILCKASSGKGVFAV